MADGTIKFDTRIDSNGFDQGIKDIESKSSKGIKDIGSKSLDLSGLMVGGIYGYIAKNVAGAVVDFGKKALSMASDLEEVQNVIDVTFGDSAGKIQTFADTASAKFGLTELQVKQFSGTFGSMAKSMGLSTDAAADMALDMTALTADMASFYNLDHDTAFEKLRSGLSGETEPLKALGINMSVANLEAFALAEGIETAYDKMTEAERVQLRYNYIMSATSDAQGDFERTSDGFANQLRLLSNNIDSLTTSIGSALLPAATMGLQAINSLFTLGADSKTLAEIKAIGEAITGEDGLDAKIDNLKANYAETIITLKLDKKDAEAALAAYDKQLADFYAAQEALGNGTIKLGETSDAVTELQTLLKNLGYLKDEISGTYDDATQAAVAAFQKDNADEFGLVVDGLAGTYTKAALLQVAYSGLTESVNTLCTIYPELNEYVDESTGLFDLEASKISELTQGYYDMAKAKAYAEMLSGYEQAYMQAEVDAELLVTKRDQTQEALDNNRRAIFRQSDFATRADDIASDVMDAETNGDLYNEENGKAVAQYIEDYIKFYRELTGDEYNGVDPSSIDNFGEIFDADGNVKDISEMSAEAYQAMLDLMDAFKNANAESIISTRAEMEDQIESINTANEYIDEAYEVLETKRADYAIAASTYNRMTGEEIATDLGESVLSNVETTKTDIDEFFDQLDDQVATRSASLVAAASNPIYSRSNASARGHATGIDYVPYNGYRATLHVGERVLTAAENSAYSNGGGNADFGALIAALNQSQDRGDIVVTVDGHELARYMASDTRAALSEHSKRLAKGRGL